MRILIDECVDPGIAVFLDEHETLTVQDVRWKGTADAELIQLARGRIDVLLTLDRGFEFQHNLKRLTFGIVILHPKRNRAEDYARLAADLRTALRAIHPGQVLHVG